MIFQEVAVETIDKGLEAAGSFRHRDTQFLAKSGDQFRRRLAGVEDQGHVHVLRGIFDKAPAQGRFPCSNLPCELYEAPVLGHSIKEVGQCLPMPLCEEQEARVRGQGEGVLFQMEEVEIHGFSLIPERVGRMPEPRVSVPGLAGRSLKAAIME